MKTSLLLLSLAAFFLLIAGTAVTAHGREGDAEPKDFRVELNPLEVVASVETISAPGFPNTSMNPFRRTPVHRFSVRYAGKPFALDVERTSGRLRIETFNMLYQLMDAPKPALLLPSAGFYLLTADTGGVRLEALEVVEHQDSRLQWLDSDAGQPGPEFMHSLALRKPSDIELRGGRWLLLNRTTVLDVATLRHYPVQPWIASSSNQPMAGLNASTRPAIMFSPDRTQYVLLGEGPNNPPENGFDYALLVVDIPGARSYSVDIPPPLQSDRIQETASAQWIQSHYEWKSADGNTVLTPRH
jgi:hypothetical protein